jgi:hypothetical protein
VEDDVVTELAQMMLDRVAGVDDRVIAEKRMFPALAQAYLQDRRRALTGDRRSGPLKFGVEDVAVFLTPVMLEAAHATLVYLTSTAALRGVKWSVSLVRRLFGFGNASDSGPDELTAEQWVQVRRIIENVLRTHGALPAERAGLLADAVVGQGRIAEAEGGGGQ